MDVEYNLVRHYTIPKSMSLLINEDIRGEHFTKYIHAEMFAFAKSYFVRTGLQHAATEELLADEFPQWFARNEWPENEYHVGMLVEKLKENYARKRLWEVHEESAERGQADPHQAIDWAVAELARIKFNTSTLERQRDYFASFEARAEAYYDRVLEDNQTLAEEGIPLGWPEITEYTFGMKRGELGFIVAATGVGKSWSTGKFALMAALAGRHTYLASLENSLELTEKRLDCLLTGVPWDRYERNQLSTVEVATLRRGGEIIQGLQDDGLLIVDCPRKRHERSTFDLYARARHADAEFFIGDQLSWVKPRSEYAGNKTAQMEEIVSDIADLSREYNIASMWAAQFNREASSQSKGRGKLHNIGLSTWIEQTADLVFSLSRTEEMEQNEAMLFEILKMRRGAKKVWLLDWKLTDETLLSVKREWRDE